ncbi:MAG: T9SS type A sorting domain-containing protein [Candidatus Cyclobacteriaceae bacterium M2_1C_046]
MNKIFFTPVYFLFFFSAIGSYAQNADCQNASAAEVYFFNQCDNTGAPYSDPDDYRIKIADAQTFYINGDVTIAGTLYIDLVGSTSKLVILSPHTLKAGNIVFKGSATGKVIEVQGPEGKLVVDGTLDFGGLDLEIDGEGSIDAESIIGADKVNCSTADGGGSTCPTITANTCDSGTTFCETTVTPVELLFFKASGESNSVKLIWATATEENFDYFTLERSTDAKNYEVLGTIEGNGWSESVINYSYTDNHPLNGRSYYRLKATDLDETYEYFQPVMVNFNNDNRAIRLDNNPVGDEPVKFKLNFAPEGDMEVTITNLSGVEVYRGNHQPGISIYSVNNKLDNGMYLLKVKTQEGTYTARFLKK